MKVDVSQDSLPRGILERDAAPGDFSFGSAGGKDFGTLLEITFFLQDLEYSLQTYFGSLNRAVCLANGVDGPVQRRQIRGKDNESTDGQTTGQYVERSYPNDSGGPDCDYPTYLPSIKSVQEVKVKARSPPF